MFNKKKTGKNDQPDNIQSTTIKIIGIPVFTVQKTIVFDEKELYKRLATKIYKRLATKLEKDFLKAIEKRMGGN